MKKNDFTLIELLVVVAIIGILVTILMPSLTAAREKAKVLVCLSNHKQMNTAYHAYAAANGQRAVLHKWYADWAGSQGTHGWVSSYTPETRPLNRYLNNTDGNSKIARCPSDIGVTNRTYNDMYTVYGNSYYAKYAATVNIDPFTNITDKSGKVWFSGIFTTSFDYPSDKAMFYNSNLNSGRDWNHANGKAKWHSKKKALYPTSFLDGHAVNHNFSWKTFSKIAPNVGGGIEGRIEAYGYY